MGHFEMSEFGEDKAWREMGRRRFEAADAPEGLVYERLMDDGVESSRTERPAD